MLVCTQVIIPAYEGLLPLEHNRTILELLFELANTHALAKLCLHTEVTVDLLEVSTDYMYHAMDKFARTAWAVYNVYERADEVEARPRRQREKNPNVPVNGARRKIEFNTNKTIKYHAAGHYPDYIQSHGPLDNYSTQTVSTLQSVYVDYGHHTVGGKLGMCYHARPTFRTILQVSALGSTTLFSQPTTGSIDIGISSPPAPPVSGSLMSALLTIRWYVSTPRKRGTCWVVTLTSTSNHIVVLMMGPVDSEHRRSASSRP